MTKTAENTETAKVETTAQYVAKRRAWVNQSIAEAWKAVRMLEQALNRLDAAAQVKEITTETLAEVDRLADEIRFRGGLAGACAHDAAGSLHWSKVLQDSPDFAARLAEDEAKREADAANRASA